MYDKSIALLNRAVGDELGAVHQYLYFHFHCTDQGLNLLADLFKKTAMVEMHHVEKLSERILFLKGDLNLESSKPVTKIKTVKGMLELARQMEQASMTDYNRSSNECVSDAASRRIFEDLVAQEETHFNEFDIELQNLEKYGDNYLALQSAGRNKP